MANIEVDIAGRRYTVSCRDGEEEQLRAIAGMVDKRARDAGEALGSLTEVRQLLFASLLLADDVRDMSSAKATPTDSELPDALERLASRVEALAERLEERAAAP